MLIDIDTPSAGRGTEVLWNRTYCRHLCLGLALAIPARMRARAREAWLECGCTISGWKPTENHLPIVRRQGIYHRSIMPPGKEELINLIKAADKDGNGFISAAEMKEAIKSMSPGDDDQDLDKNVEMFMKMADTDGDKKLKIEEIINFLSPEEEGPEQRMKTMYRMYDTDGNGTVSTKEFAAFMKTRMADDSDDEDFNDMIANSMAKKADLDGDGVINFEEFCKMMDRS